MPPMNSTLRGPCPMVFTRIGRPWTDLPTTSQPPASVGVGCGGAVVGGSDAYCVGVAVGESGRGVVGPDTGSGETAVEAGDVVGLAVSELQPDAASPVVNASRTTTAVRVAVSTPTSRVSASTGEP